MSSANSASTQRIIECPKSLANRTRRRPAPHRQRSQATPPATPPVDVDVVPEAARPVVDGVRDERTGIVGARQAPDPTTALGSVSEVTTVVFSGHMVDAPGRGRPRFPPNLVPQVRRRIEEAVGTIDDPNAEAVSGAACGSDLLFCEVWLAGGRRLRVFLPRQVEAFLDESVRFAGPEWEAAYRRVVGDDLTVVVEPDPGMAELEDPHTPNNLRMLDRARQGSAPLIGIFVWDGQGGDGPGGTRHMVSEIEASGGKVTVIPPGTTA